MQPIKCRVNARLVNPLNTREHWAARARRAREQRQAAKFALMLATGGSASTDLRALDLSIVITRCGGRVMDSDGLVASAKHIRDGVADWLGIDDGDKRLTWGVRQGKAKPGQHWVEVEICAVSHKAV